MKGEKLKAVYYTFFFLIVIFLSGVAGYMIIEKYPFIDAVFMTIITITTVGFEEVHPLSDAGMIFTSVLIILSVGIFAFSATTIFQYIVNGVIFNHFKDSKVKKEIEQLNHHVIVVGYGRNGLQAIVELKQHNIPLVVVENREVKIKEIQQRNDLLYIKEDPSSDEVLITAGIKKAKALISVLPSDEENVFVVITARELNPKITIISRAINFNTIKKLKTAGASHVIMPDKISGQHMANMIAQPDMMDFIYHLILDRTKDSLLEEVSCKQLNNRNTTISNLKKNLNINIIGVKRKDGSYEINPDHEVILTCDDMLFVLGQGEDIAQFKSGLEEE
jgi:voltage-gated potassium channel